LWWNFVGDFDGITQGKILCSCSESMNLNKELMWQTFATVARKPTETFEGI